MPDCLPPSAEAALAGRLHHPNVVAIVDARGAHGGVHEVCTLGGKADRQRWAGEPHFIDHEVADGRDGRTFEVAQQQAQAVANCRELHELAAVVELDRGERLRQDRVLLDRDAVLALPARNSSAPSHAH